MFNQRDVDQKIATVRTNQQKVTADILDRKLQIKTELFSTLGEKQTAFTGKKNRFFTTLVQKAKKGKLCQGLLHNFNRYHRFFNNNRWWRLNLRFLNDNGNRLWSPL